MLDKSKLLAGQSYNILVEDWSKFKQANLKDDSFKTPIQEHYQADVSLVFVMKDFLCDQVEIVVKDNKQDDFESSAEIKDNIIRLKRNTETKKNYMFYDPTDDRFIYAKESDFEVKDSLTLPAVYTFEKINEANLNRLAYVLNSKNIKSESFNFYFSKNEKDVSDIFYEKVLNFLFPYNKIRSGGKFLIQNPDGSFDSDNLDKEILYHLNGQSHEKYYRTIIRYKKKRYKVFPCNDWEIIDKVPVDEKGNPIEVIGGEKRGIMLCSNKLNICIAIPAWNFSKLLVNGYVYHGKLLGTYGIILSRGETTLLLPSNGKLFKKLMALDRCSAGFFDELLIANNETETSKSSTKRKVRKTNKTENQTINNERTLIWLIRMMIKSW